MGEEGQPVNPETSHLLDAITPDVDPETVPEPAGTVSGAVLFACLIAFAALVALAFRAAGVIQ